MKIEMLLTEDTEHGVRHVVMRADGGEGEQQHIVSIIELLTKALQEGKRVIVRHVPSLNCDTEFNTDYIVHWTATSRFTVVTSEGRRAQGDI